MAKSGTTVQTTVAVIGGGINGLCCAWQLALRGAKVTLFERGKLMEQTGGQCFGPLHGGMRYLENGELRLVYEALQERQWWLQHCPHLCEKTLITVPLYSDGPRKRWLVNGGLHLYDGLASGKLGKHHWVSRNKLMSSAPELHAEKLLGAYRYSEVQMDVLKLGRWVAQQARAAGAQLVENSPIRYAGDDGNIHLDSYRHRFDLIVNAAGRCSRQLLQQSSLCSKNRLDLVRNSSLLFDGLPGQSYLLQIPHEGHSLFVLPWQGRTLVGAIDARQAMDQGAQISEQEIDYLLHQYNRHFKQQRGRGDIVETPSSTHSHVQSSTAAHKMSGEYLLERQQKLLIVWGGQWTTARALGRKVATQLLD
jgi:glycerol-3-phosphate dehydrogenase